MCCILTSEAGTYQMFGLGETNKTVASDLGVGEVIVKDWKRNRTEIENGSSIIECQ